MNTEKILDDYYKEFRDAISQDLNVTKAMGIVWKVAKSDLPLDSKRLFAKEVDKVLGLDLLGEDGNHIPKELNQVINKLT